MVEEQHLMENDFWSFDSDFARNVVIVCVDNSSSSHTNNLKDNFSVLGEGPTQGINDSTGAVKLQ